MKYVTFAVPVVLLVVAATAGSQPPAGQQVTLIQAIKNGYNNSKLNLTQAAEKMPDADYTSKPGPAPEMRTYGGLFAHVAQAQFGMSTERAQGRGRG